MTTVSKIALWSLCTFLLVSWNYNAPNAALAQDVTTTSETESSQETKLRFADYEERLNALLKTRRDEEKKFVSDVMKMVIEGELPERLIETSYKWVVNKRPDTNYPFIYFERVLRIQAKLVKIEIPAFDYDIYRVKPPVRSARK